MAATGQLGNVLADKPSVQRDPVTGRFKMPYSATAGIPVLHRRLAHPLGP